MGKTHKKERNAKGPTPQLRSRNTRSTKGRLLTDTSSSTSQLNSQLSLLGLYAAPTIGDGNCLFRALSDQLYGSPSKHFDLRQAICDHIQAHTARYEPFVEDERGLEGHLRAMRENATYGGHMELSAFAHLMRRNVKVIQPGLVYVIEWHAGGEETAAAGEIPAEAAASGNGSAPGGEGETPRRSRRMSARSARPRSVSPDKGKGPEEGRVKLGKGYYVYEEVTSDEEAVEDEPEEPRRNIEGGGPTVYVAYHDWEHFSSIRNLRGPHTGLPNIVETPPQAFDEDVSAASLAKEREKERRKERERREKERKEKEKERRDKERRATGIVVKLKLPPSRSGTGTPAEPSAQDPTLVPLPSSRSASPFIHQIPSTSSLTAVASSALPSSSLASEVYTDDTQSQASQSTQSTDPGCLHSLPNEHHPRHPHPHILTQTPRSQYRSPKRSFDESSASGGEDAGSEGGMTKRSRRRVGSVSVGAAPRSSGLASTETDVLVNLGGLADDMEVDVERDGSGGADTPGLSAPGSSSSSSSALSEAGSGSGSMTSESVEGSVAEEEAGSEAGSEADVEAELGLGRDELDADADEGGSVLDEDEAARLDKELDALDDPDLDTVKLGLARSRSSTPAPSTAAGALVMPEGLSNNARQKYLHAHLHGRDAGGAKPLTRRQRKALGLPKERRVGTQQQSAGKIVIPGGRWKGRGAAPSTHPASGTQAAVGVVGHDGEHPDSVEWRRNGTGRLDVRGFRELKI